MEKRAMSDEYTAEEIRKQMRVINLGIQSEKDRYDEAMKRWNSLKRGIQGRCSHANKNSGPYSRWCTDCEENWDTT